ncbi:hypothetical protein Tco_0799737 [Tanacetum coccineum]|uniref:Uncharacterized protein n=1 Tax=Tanacetum coccineum TaxID=301880 RepID=A0ABQ4ZR57_9ASTR
MANLKYSDKHNMVAFMKKPNEVWFIEVVDFLKGTSLRYALTHNPTIYDSLVKQFWQTATVRTLANGTQQLVASIDSKEYTITEDLLSTSKQTIVANSTTEAEYVAAAHCCGQVLWIQNQMMDYGFNFMNTKIHIDNESTICVVKNPVYHSRTKHIEIRHHFIRDCYEKRLIDVLKIHTDSNVADLLTKGFDVTRISMDLRMDRCSPGKYYSSMVFNAGSLYVNTGSTKVDSGTASKRGQREGKAPMIEEDIQATHKTKEQMRQEEAGLEEAIKLQAQLDEEVAKQIHLDKMVAKRMAEEEALSEQQKKRKAQV